MDVCLCGALTVYSNYRLRVPQLTSNQRLEVMPRLLLGEYKSLLFYTLKQSTPSRLLRKETNKRFLCRRCIVV